eukprot:TRINITY_DN24463_c0_g1_i1.p1 TRINITY_DN24463_c0_g1~~TRINITY_DN24463_c0_g1_i1.p1  ORF type:complete len:203 (+),score=71.64 TRINITY_DN24463_c0_g1_i1:63-611(+)
MLRSLVGSEMCIRDRKEKEAKATDEERKLEDLERELVAELEGFEDESAADYMSPIVPGELAAELEGLESQSRAASESPRVGMDVDSMSVKELKKFLTDSGMSWTGCVEKEELTARARLAQNKMRHAQMGTGNSDSEVEEDTAMEPDALMDLLSPVVSEGALDDADIDAALAEFDEALEDMHL